MLDLNDLRKDFGKKKIEKESLESNPIDQFKIWMQEAIEAEIPEANAMILSTTSCNMQPTSRVVLLKKLDNGFVFYTNYSSRKAQEIKENECGALLFFWANLERQVKIEGKIHKLTDNESDDYFCSRPKESQISAIVSPQSKEIKSKKVLQEKFNSLQKVKNLKRPDYWGGYRLIPERIEFWQGGLYRLHDRFLYQRKNSKWDIVQLAP